MCMFDNIRCEYQLPLPNDLKGLSCEELQKGLFQTKSIDCAMSLYLIKADGSLWEITNTEPPMQIPLNNFNGDIIFYDSIVKNEKEYDYWIEYKFVFINGKVIKTELINYDASNNAKRIEFELQWENKWKQHELLWNKWYVKYGYRYYDELIHKIFRFWNKISNKIPSSQKVERFFRPL